VTRFEFPPLLMHKRYGQGGGQISMKTILISLLLLTICTKVTYGQNSKYDFAKDVFKREYKKNDFEKFNGKVGVINENTFRYGDKVLTIHTEDKSLIPIFSKGIFHADIIGGKHTTKLLTKSQLDTMSTDAKVLYNLSRNDSITIGDVEQLEKLNPNAKTKRFVFWLYNRAMANPTECYFELYNDKGTKEMTIDEFINNSRLTFFHRGTLIL
jgi:hypothetical protein